MFTTKHLYIYLFINIPMEKLSFLHIDFKDQIDIVELWKRNVWASGKSLKSSILSFIKEDLKKMEAESSHTLKVKNGLPAD